MGGNGTMLFEKWAHYALAGHDFMPSIGMAKAIDREITEGELATYDSPFPARICVAALDAFERPALGMFGLEDFIFGDEAEGNATRVAIAAAAGQPHKDYPEAGHFIHEDAGPELAADIAEWIRANPRRDS